VTALTAELSPQWWIRPGVGGPYGGRIMALLVRALAAAVDDEERPLRSLSVHFVDAAEPGPVEVTATVERVGRSSTTASLRMEQRGRPVALALAGCATWRAGEPEWLDAEMPAAPPPEQCDPVERRGDMPPFLDMLDVRFVAAGPGARNLAWVRPGAAGEWDMESLVLVSDTWMPAAFARLGHPAVVPTVDLTVHVRAPLPAGEDHLLAAFSSRAAAGGAWEEDGELWTRDGTLVAQSRQLALIRA
jgi:acyl-CoA thioesterase